MRRKNSCLADVTFNTERGITLHAVMRFYFCDDVLYTFHHLCKINFVIHIFQTVEGMFFHHLNGFSTADERLTWNAAIVETVTAHFIFFNQSDFCFDCSTDKRTDQSPGTCTDSNKIKICFRHLLLLFLLLLFLLQ